MEAGVDPVPDLLAYSSGTPAIRAMTSTGNGPEKSCTRSNSSDLIAPRYFSMTSTIDSLCACTARG